MRGLFCFVACAVCACGGNNSTPKDASVGSDGPVAPIDAAQVADANGDAATSAFAYCIDRPDNPGMTSRPPTAGLSCDLLPPPFHQ